ncbi:unnamed protein product [Mycena citricolor]|uniref:HlyIII-domain-containing protein n=1 Tax=Mycena citricolor TaxID=2018698 RepID=A0AAD2GWU5_9AGAR|nr:unnamed protein product [Mycena citricolor]
MASSMSSRPMEVTTTALQRTPRLRHRRMSAPIPDRPTRLPPCRPLPLSLEALDLSPTSPAQALASLRFVVLSHLAHLERRLSLFESAEWVSTALDMLHSIRAEVHSHIPDLLLLPDNIEQALDNFKPRDFDFSFDFDHVKAKLKKLVAGLELDSIDLSKPMSYVPTLSVQLRNLQTHLADCRASFNNFDFDFDFGTPTLPRAPAFDFDFDFARAPAFDFDLPTLTSVFDAVLAELPSLPSLPVIDYSLPATISRASSSLTASLKSSSEAILGDLHESEADAQVHARALALAEDGRKLVTFDDVPYAWQNNPYVQWGYRFIPLRRWPAIVVSAFTLHNETMNIMTHLIPLIIWGLAFCGVVFVPGAPLLSSPGVVSVVDALGWCFSWLPTWLTREVGRYTPFAAYSISSEPVPSSIFISPYPSFGFFAASAPSPGAIFMKSDADTAESFFTLFALACLACSVLWHTMSGCSHRGAMEACARIDYVGIGWLIATSISTVVHYGYACAEAVVDSTPLGHAVLHPSTMLTSPPPVTWADDVDRGLGPAMKVLLTVALTLGAPFVALASWANQALDAFLLYHPIGAACLVMSLACGVTGNVLPYCDWFNRAENKMLRLAFFVGTAFSGLAPLGGIAALQGWGATGRFIAPVVPSFLFYILGIAFYATLTPERLIRSKGRLGRVRDWFGGGSHAIWHVFIVLAIRAHRDGIREMRRVAMQGGCAAVGFGA